MPKTKVIYSLKEIVKLLKAAKIPVLKVTPMDEVVDAEIYISKKISLQVNDELGYMIVAEQEDLKKDEWKMYREMSDPNKAVTLIQKLLKK